VGIGGVQGVGWGVGLEDVPHLPEPPHVELVVSGKTHRANRLTTLRVAVPSVVGEWHHELEVLT